MTGAQLFGERTDAERDEMAREFGYDDARALVQETIRILQRNTYAAMQEARQLLERAEKEAGHDPR